jgi:hypothetical protein
MKNTLFGRARRPLAVAASAALAVLVTGCVSYTPSQLSAMSTVDICETEYMQRPNLSPQAKQAIQGELQRRNDSCANHRVEVAQRYDAFMYREMYGKQDNP